MAGGTPKVPGLGEPGAAFQQAQDPRLEGAGGDRQVLVLAPFGDVAGQVEQAVAIGREGTHGRGKEITILGSPIMAQIGAVNPARVRGLRPPRVGLAGEAAPGRGLPLGLAGQTSG